MGNLVVDSHMQNEGNGWAGSAPTPGIRMGSRNRFCFFSVKVSSGDLRRSGRQSMGENARELNRSLLSELRRGEKKTRLRAEWTSGNTTERFFDYVAKAKTTAK